jgi:hypothetical protein
MIAATLAAVSFVFVSRASAQQLPTIAPAPSEAPAAPAFTPPANGRLTAAQVRMFIEVRRATAASSEQWSGNADNQINALLRSFEEEARAAAAHGASVDEYRWVSGKVMEAMPEAATGPDAILSAIAAAVRNAPALVADATGQQAAPVKAPDASASALAYNRQLLSRFQTELRALRPASRP